MYIVSLMGIVNKLLTSLNIIYISLNVQYNISKGVFTIINIEKKISMALAYSEKSQAELARQMGQNPSNFNQKIKRETLKQEDYEKIAEILGCKWCCYFEFEDGTRI